MCYVPNRFHQFKLYGIFLCINSVIYGHRDRTNRLTLCAYPDTYVKSVCGGWGLRGSLLLLFNIRWMLAAV